jgi:hypothetical protein
MHKKSFFLIFTYIFMVFFVSTDVYGVKEEESDLKDLTYSVSLMWINKSLDENQKYIVSKEEYLKPIIAWALETDKEAPVYFWYDSQHSYPKAIQNTEKYLKEKIGGKRSPILFKDVRNLQYVKENEKVFSNEVPIYFRADLLREIVKDYLASLEDTDFIVYSDLNVPPLSKTKLFDEKTLEQLKKDGLVMSEGHDMNRNYENAFSILDSHNKTMIYASKIGLIDINIDRALYVLEKGYSEKKGTACSEKNFPQVVYSSYLPMYKYYLFLEMRGEIGKPKESKFYKDSPFFKGKMAQVEDFKIENTNYEFTILKEASTEDFSDELDMQSTEKRMKVDYKTFFNIHNCSTLGKAFYMWVEKTLFRQEKSHIVLEQTEFKNLPTKDVKKPKSHFFDW